MPLYTYSCRSCGREAVEFQRMRDDPFVSCKFCGRDTLEKIPSMFDTGGLKPYIKPIDMFSVACNTEEEIKELQEKCPDVQMSVDKNDPMYGVPVVANRRQKLSVLKAVGYKECN